jgi:predicted acetyltransferase
MDLYCMDGLTLVKATAQDADVVFRLMQLYYFEASAWSGEEILADGLYDCALADVRARLQEEPEWTRLLWLDGQLCGFVQVDEVDFQGRRLPELADLFILPKHRGKGIASAVVAELVRPTAGEWLLATFRKDHVAHAFWERNLARMGMAVQHPSRVRRNRLPLVPDQGDMTMGSPPAPRSALAHARMANTFRTVQPPMGSPCSWRRRPKAGRGWLGLTGGQPHAADRPP